MYVFSEISTAPHCSVETSSPQVASDITGTISSPTIMKSTLFIPFMGNSIYMTNKCLCNHMSMFTLT